MSTRKNVATSLQVSFIGNIPDGDFEINEEAFLLKNITDSAISVSIQPYSSKDVIETILYPGWNPELVKKIYGALPNTLQYGY